MKKRDNFEGKFIYINTYYYILVFANKYLRMYLPLAFYYSQPMTSRGYFSSLTREQEDSALLNKLAVPEASYNRLSTLLSRLVQTTSPEELL